MALFLVTLGDPNNPKPPIFHILYPFSYLRSGEIDFKFDRQADRIKCQPTDENSSLKRAWPGDVNRYNFAGQHQSYLWNG